jgi:transposase
LCDCLAHRLGNAADQPERTRRYDSDLTDAEWAIIRPLLPVPWLNRRGGRRRLRPPPDDRRGALPGRRGRALGIPARRLPKWQAVYRFFRRWRDNVFIQEPYGRLRTMMRALARRP